MPTHRLESLMDDAPMPAVAVSVFDDKQAVFSHVVRAGRDDWWDLASLTKVLVTLPEALEHLELDRPLYQIWPPALGHPIAEATVRRLLSHNAGLPATVQFFRTSRDRADVVARALATPLEPTGEAVYSDIGYLLLGEVVAEVTGRSLPDLAARRTGLRFAPLPGPAVPTEICPWRQRLIVGEVHDENAAAMEGVAGHAGAFGTLALVTAAAQAVFTSGAEQRCWATNSNGERFGLGWWLTPTRGLGGPSPGPNSYGHSGFVGNRIWFEPDRGYGVVILSNRVHPHRGDRAPFSAWCDRLLMEVARWWS